MFTPYVLTACMLGLLGIADQIPPQPEAEKPVRMPSGRLQSEEILKADHARSLEDSARILKLAEELKIEIEKNDRYVLSLGAIRKTEEIEKLAKRIRGRMKRF